MTKLAGALPVMFVAAACSTWDSMTHSQQATSVGAASGAAGGAVVAGPAGAAVGGVAGGVVGHEAAKDEHGSQANKTAAADNTPSTSQASNSPPSSTGGNETTSRSAATTADASTSATQGIGPKGNGTVSGSQQDSGDNTLNASRSATTNTSDGMIRAAQQALNDRGYNAGPADGLMGPKTEDAIRKFQSSHGLASTGRLDSATVAALHVSQSDKSALN
jgi:hypothetical protein